MPEVKKKLRNQVFRSFCVSDALRQERIKRKNCSNARSNNRKLSDPEPRGCVCRPPFRDIGLIPANEINLLGKRQLGRAGLQAVQHAGFCLDNRGRRIGRCCRNPTVRNRGGLRILRVRRNLAHGSGRSESAGSGHSRCRVRIVVRRNTGRRSGRRNVVRGNRAGSRCRAACGKTNCKDRENQRFFHAFILQKPGSSLKR